jgi:hypothetical protein
MLLPRLCALLKLSPGFPTETFGNDRVLFWLQLCALLLFAIDCPKDLFGEVDGFPLTKPRRGLDTASRSFQRMAEMQRGAPSTSKIVIASVLCEVPLLDSAHKRDSKSGTICPSTYGLSRSCPAVQDQAT